MAGTATAEQLYTAWGPDSLPQLQGLSVGMPTPEITALELDSLPADLAQYSVGNIAVSECMAEDSLPYTAHDEQTSSRASLTVAAARPAKAEIYGRSLRTIYRLGMCMVENAGAVIIQAPETAQARAEFYTSVEEGFGTDRELGSGLEVRDFDVRPVMDGKVMAKDLKTAISDMTEAGLECAEEKYSTEQAQGDHRFKPQLIRSHWDHDNAVIVDRMARGETAYNTRIVISPFPEEAALESGDEYWRDIGYVPHVRRGFVQLYHAGEDGLIAGSLSFNGSHKARLRELFHGYGITIPETEITDNWLQYAITDTLSEDDAKALALEIADQAGEMMGGPATNTVEVTSEHHKLMDAVFNESYIHLCESLYRGRQTPGARKLIFLLADKAGHFNSRYRHALYSMRANEHQFTDDDSVVLHELLVYSTIEMMRAMHLRAQTPSTSTRAYGATYPDLTYMQSLDTAAFQNALSDFGAAGARNNRTYSACGLSISAGETTRASDGPQRAFGGTTESMPSRTPEDKYGSLEFDCPKCHHTNRRPRGKLIPHCQKCGADVRC